MDKQIDEDELIAEDNRHHQQSYLPILVLALLLPAFFFLGWMAKGDIDSQTISPGLEFGVGGAPFDQSTSPFPTNPLDMQSPALSTTPTPTVSPATGATGAIEPGRMEDDSLR